MVSDSIVNANSSKDIGKKKRANRNTKLKQYKLDARREQWLSQGKIKGVKEEVSGGDGNGGSDVFNGRAIETRKAASIPPCCNPVQVRSASVEEIHNHDSDSESSSLTNSPTSCLTVGENRYGGSSSSCSSGSSRASSSSFGSGGCCFSSMTEEEEAAGGEFGGADDDDGCLDDWEAVADALAASDKQGSQDDSDRMPEKEAIFRSDSEPAALRARDQNGHARVFVETGKSESVGILGSGGANTGAWRADDAFRPQSLPNLSKQRSFPANPDRLSWVRKNMPPCVPSSCPICCEDLDVTDSSFLPCPCGFHLCLFCHKRIIEGDGRCPGCRKPYASEVAEKETTVSSGSLTIRLARSSSMFSRF